VKYPIWWLLYLQYCLTGHHFQTLLKPVIGDYTELFCSFSCKELQSESKCLLDSVVVVTRNPQPQRKLYEQGKNILFCKLYEASTVLQCFHLQSKQLVILTHSFSILCIIL